MKSTIALFKELYNNLPPLFPEETKKKIGHALMHLEKDHSLRLHEIEETMIVFGYEAWPWRRAYEEFYTLAESKVGEHFLLPKLNSETKKRFHDFKIYGGTLRDLYSGRPAEFFTAEERKVLREGLIETRIEVKNFTDREIIGVEKVKYLNRVEEFIGILNLIKKTLHGLKKIADDEQDHPALAEEIRSRVRGFEYGLCLLGPELDIEEVFRAPHHFAGRKHELGRLKGINVAEELVLD